MKNIVIKNIIREKREETRPTRIMTNDRTDSLNKSIELISIGELIQLIGELIQLIGELIQLEN
jgi:transposase